MESPKPTIARQSSGMKNIPSFNDFGKPQILIGLLIEARTQSRRV
jgi:hypothetical protein